MGQEHKRKITLRESPVTLMALARSNKAFHPHPSTNTNEIEPNVEDMGPGWQTRRALGGAHLCNTAAIRLVHLGEREIALGRKAGGLLLHTSSVLGPIVLPQRNHHHQ